MSNSGFIQIPKSFLTGFIWNNLSLEYRHIFTTILIHMAFKPTQMNSFGHIVTVQPGQFLTTLEDLERLCKHKKIKESKIYRAWQKFNLVGISKQETKHGKTLITITEPAICELLKNQNETGFDTRTKQERNIKEEDNNNTYNISKRKNLSDSKPEIVDIRSFQQETLEESDNIYVVVLEGLRITKKFHEKLLEEEKKLGIENFAEKCYEHLSNWKNEKIALGECVKHTDEGMIRKWVKLAVRKNVAEEKEVELKEQMNLQRASYLSGKPSTSQQSNFQKHKSFAREESKDLESEDCELNFGPFAAFFIFKITQGNPIEIKYSDETFKEDFLSQLVRHKFKKRKVV